MRRTITLVLLSVLPLLACDDDPAGPARAEVAGEYEATTFLAVTQQGELDVVAAGGALDLVLDADGTTSGTLLVPGGDEDGSDFEADLTGTWVLEGSNVGFSHPEDTFIRDLVWVYRDGRLSTSNAVVDIVLTRR